MLQNHDAFLEAKCAEEEAKGRKPGVIPLIAALRDHSAIGLKEAKDTVEDFLRRRVHTGSPGPVLATSQDRAAWLRHHISQIESTGEKPNYIHLIKELREHSNLGLKEAKDAVDEFCDRERPDIKAHSGGGFLESVARLLGVVEVD